jgi:transcriptional regulator with XRE-family HTH domain
MAKKSENNDLRAVLSENIKQFRQRLGLSQGELAEKAGISITFLSAIERQKKWPYPETLANISIALGVEVWELFKQDEVLPSEIANAIGKCLDDVSLSIRANMNKAILQSIEKVREFYVKGP